MEATIFSNYFYILFHKIHSHSGAVTTVEGVEEDCVKNTIFLQSEKHGL